MKYRKITEQDLLARFQPGMVLIAPLEVRKCDRQVWRKGNLADAIIELAFPNEPTGYNFLVEAKAQNTPLIVKNAMEQVKAIVEKDECPLIIVPYLSQERLDDLERELVSGVDLCGNGIIIVPRVLYIRRTGNPNLYPSSRPLADPYRGLSAMVARMILSKPSWGSLNQLVDAIGKGGIQISPSQVSKAVRALEDDMMIGKLGRFINVNDPVRLLDKLGNAFETSFIRRESVRLPKMDFAKSLSADSALRWSVTGESSAKRYTAYSQGGPLRLAVSDMDKAVRLLGATSERVPNFADLELIETNDPGFYFMNAIDKEGVRWASLVQTWLELQAGDPRQLDAARDLRKLILKDAKNAESI